MLIGIKLTKLLPRLLCMKAVGYLLIKLIEMSSRVLNLMKLGSLEVGSIINPFAAVGKLI